MQQVLDLLSNGNQPKYSSTASGAFALAGLFCGDFDGQGFDKSIFPLVELCTGYGYSSVSGSLGAVYRYSTVKNTPNI